MKSRFPESRSDVSTPRSPGAGATSSSEGSEASTCHIRKLSLKEVAI